MLGQLLFLLCINDLTGDLHFNLKLFEDYICLFSTAANAAPSNSYLNEDLSKSVIGFKSGKRTLIQAKQNPS